MVMRQLYGERRKNVGLGLYIWIFWFSLLGIWRIDKIQDSRIMWRDKGIDELFLRWLGQNEKRENFMINEMVYVGE